MGEPLDNQDWKEDVATLYLPFCERQIDSHQKNIRWQWIFTAFEILLGAALTILAFVFFRTDTAKIFDIIFKLGPSLLLATVSALHYRLILGSRESLSSYMPWKDRFQRALRNNTMPPDWLTTAVAENMREGVKPWKKPN